MVATTALFRSRTTSNTAPLRGAPCSSVFVISILNTYPSAEPPATKYSVEVKYVSMILPFDAKFASFLKTSPSTGS